MKTLAEQTIDRVLAGAKPMRALVEAAKMPKKMPAKVREFLVAAGRHGTVIGNWPTGAWSKALDNGWAEGAKGNSSIKVLTQAGKDALRDDRVAQSGTIDIYDDKVVTSYLVKLSPETWNAVQKLHRTDYGQFILPREDETLRALLATHKR